MSESKCLREIYGLNNLEWMDNVFVGAVITGPKPLLLEIARSCTDLQIWNRTLGT